MVRRGADLVLEGLWDLANAEFCWRDRVLPLSGDEEGMLRKNCHILRVRSQVVCKNRSGTLSISVEKR